MVELDETDKKIITHLCQGVKSYSQLAEIVGVSRNTVYRRVKKLEEKNAVKEKNITIPNFGEIGYYFALIGMDVSPEDLDDALEFLKDHDKVKLLWKTYGFYEIIILLISEKDELGNSVNEIRGELEKRNIEVRRYGVSPGISWEKLDFSLKGL